MAAFASSGASQVAEPARFLLGHGHRDRVLGEVGHGIAEVVQRQGHLGPGSYLVITPMVSWSWGMEELESEQGPVGPRKILWQ